MQPQPDKLISLSSLQAASCCGRAVLHATSRPHAAMPGQASIQDLPAGLLERCWAQLGLLER